MLLANGAHVAHGGVVLLRKEEAHAHLIKQLFAQLGALLDVHAQRLLAVGRARLAGSGTVAVLGNLRPTCGDNKRSCGGDVEAARFVATRAHNLKHRLVVLHLGSVTAHGSSATGNFRDGFALGRLRGKGGKECRRLHLRGFARHDLVDHIVGLVVG